MVPWANSIATASLACGLTCFTVNIQGFSPVQVFLTGGNTNVVTLQSQRPMFKGRALRKAPIQIQGSVLSGIKLLSELRPSKPVMWQLDTQLGYFNSKLM